MRFAPVLALSFLASPVVLGAQARDSVARSPSYWPRLGYGVATSLLLHETAHVLTGIALGGHPTFGFDRLRPTFFSGISVRDHPRKQFWYSASGLLSQSLLDEGLLDIPHKRGSAFERGLLGGGIGTAVFYLTIGRSGSVSDAEFMMRTHVLSRNQITLLFGGIAAIHAFRLSRDEHYASFFVGPRNGGLDLGVELTRF